MMRRVTPMNDPVSLKAEAGRLFGNVHVLPLRVYYEDTDVGGIVYYANYLKFMERGRSDMLRLVGIDQKALMTDVDEGLMFAVCDCHMEYLKPARYDDQITVHTWLREMTGATLTMGQEVRRGHEILVKATVRAATLNLDAKARRMPPKIRHILNALVCSTPEID